ncbi:MAG: pantetheine-phosphate adenylyltransferase [Clostridiales Family XIII bacterium]|jgi:pantetheine-phosphate adenylyltransferase|nr:pantetheine-phosphate adenylyltransferase [Clostridiales Family XIII bacterium]
MNREKMLYAGTFDPITKGHLDVITRAARLTGTLIVGVLENSEKKPMYSTEQRIEMIRLATKDIDNVEIIAYDGLLADYINANGIAAVVRGLRASMDFEYEINIAQLNARLFNEGVETIFLMTNPSHSFISSSIVKEVFCLGGETKGLVPDEVLEYMNKIRDGETSA